MSHPAKTPRDDRLRNGHPEPPPPRGCVDDSLLDHHIEEVLGAIHDLDRLRLEPDVY